MERSDTEAADGGVRLSKSLIDDASADLYQAVRLLDDGSLGLALKRMDRALGKLVRSVESLARSGESLTVKLAQGSHRHRAPNLSAYLDAWEILDNGRK